VRETLFNWLGQDLSGWRCIDAFAGTGALGLEAASRGASEVRLIEQDSALVAQLSRLQLRLQAAAVRVERGDGVRALQRLAPASMDLVLLDPPFDSPLLAQALPEAARALAPLPKLLGYGYAWLKPSGKALLMKGKDTAAELAEARRSWTFTVAERESLSSPEGRVLTISSIEPRRA
jgi:16S rRNA (guanine(966)-N(2))-methyltransferase RsmD